MEKKTFGLLFKAISHLLHNQAVIMKNLSANNFYTINDTEELSELSSQLADAYYKADDNNNGTLLDNLNQLKEKYPNQKIYFKTAKNNFSYNMQDVVMYENSYGEIVIEL